MTEINCKKCVVWHQANHPRQLINKMGKEFPKCVICPRPTKHARIKTCSLECAGLLKKERDREWMKKGIEKGYYTRKSRRERKLSHNKVSKIGNE